MYHPCQRGVRTCPCAHVLTGQKHANFSFLHANTRAKDLPIFQFGVPTCQKACQFLIFICQKLAAVFQLFWKELYFFTYLTYLYLVHFIYFMYLKYIANIRSLYEYIYIFYLPNSIRVQKGLFRKAYIMHIIILVGKGYIM